MDSCKQTTQKKYSIHVAAVIYDMSSATGLREQDTLNTCTDNGQVFKKHHSPHPTNTICI